MRPYAKERLAQMAADRLRVTRQGMALLRPVARRLVVAALSAYRDHGDVALAVRNALAGAAEIVQDGMTTAHLTARMRTAVVVAGLQRQRSRAMAAGFDAAQDFLKRRLNLDPAAVAALREKYGPTAIEVTRGMSMVAEAAAQNAVREIAAAGYHVAEGTRVLRERLAAAGVGPMKPHLVETLYRTQIQEAYSAGQWNATKDDPDIDEILWGWEYVTAGDDRVRPNHYSLDGVRLAKDDPRWSQLWPPNGFNCRCQAIEIYDHESDLTVEEPPPDEVSIDGQTVHPGPDKGWGWNSGEVYRDMIPPPPFRSFPSRWIKVHRKHIGH